MASCIQLSIIVVSWKVPDLLRDCLRSIYREMSLAPDRFEVIVVDNASGDNTVAMLRDEFPTIVCIALPENIGFGRANTLAFGRARGEFVLLLNPDTLIRDQGIDRLLAHMRGRPEVVAMGCRLVNPDLTLQRWTGGRFPTLCNVAFHYLFVNELLGPLGLDRSIYLTRDIRRDRDVDWVSGACMLLRRAAAPEPLFDPEFFMYGEDMELCHRLKRAGGRIVYSPVASVIHYQGASIRQQSGDILLTSLKGMRSFYRRSAGPLRARAFDLLTLLGFGLRWSAYRAAGLVHRDPGWRERARSSAQYFRIALALMRG